MNQNLNNRTVAIFQIPATVTHHSLIPRDSASILIVISGRATAGDLMLERGSIIFLPSNQVLNIHCAHSTQGLNMFQAMCNV
jgi:hypothetical protein